MEKEYYVYAILDPRYPQISTHINIDFEYRPIYIGKGRDSRIYSHLYESRLANNSGNKLKNNLLNKIIKSGLEPLLEILIDDLNEKEAFDLEKELIRSIGRRDLGNGHLVNLTNGGEGQSGSTSFIKENNPFYGKKHKPESFKNISKVIIQKDLDGNYISKFRSIEEAGRETKSIPSKISMCAKGKAKTHNGYKWEYDDPINIETTKKTGKKTKFKYILQKDLDGNLVQKWDKIVDILSENSNYKKGNLIDTLKDRTPSYKGYIWEYYNE